MKFDKIKNILVDPETKKPLKYEDNYFKSDSNKYFIENDIISLYLKDEETDDTTSLQKEFYEDVMFPNYDDLDDFSSLIEKSEGSMFAKKLDQEIPYSSKVVEIGCGTGQLSNFLSRYNRLIVGTDLSTNSLKLANDFKKKNSIDNVYFIEMNLFKPCFQENTFDVVISNGCLHHTSNPEKAFSSICKLAKSGGYIVIGLYHKNGRLFTNIRQHFFKIFNNRFKFLDPKNVDSSISESKRYAWFRDQYQNPKEFSYGFNEIFNWFKDNKIEYLSSIPFHGFDANFKIFEKYKKPNNFKIFMKELMMTFDIDQIKEGGFFIMVGKKN